MFRNRRSKNTDCSRDTPVGAGRMRIWDVPTRAFHWAIVLLVTTSWVAADNGFMQLHLWSGLSVLTLVIFRVIWGIVGSTTARFSNFLAGPGAVMGYLSALLSGRKPLHAGHNPAGGWMVVALMAMLVAQAATGLFANDGVHFNGPLATLVSAETSDRLTEIHGTMFDVLLLLIWVHLVAVLFYLCVKGENLVGPMLTGKKLVTHVPAHLDLRFRPVPLALLCLLLAMGVVWWIVRT